MLGYPIVRLVTLALQKFGLKQQFGAPADWVGLEQLPDDPRRRRVLGGAAPDRGVLRGQRRADDGARAWRSPCC